jgi:hypothetical protein
MCDRLESLNDQESARRLNWIPEVSLSVQSPTLQQTITGWADYCLAYGDKCDPQTALIVLYVFRHV